MITTVCKISYGSQTVPPIVPAVQGDTGRAISFEIADFTPPAGATATYFILKPSGEAIYNSATITDNSILCELTAQSLAEAGENRMQVRVLQGEDIVTSFEVILMVRTFLGDDAIESGTEMNIFDQAVEQATEQFQENAEQIVEEVIESIPADYTALTEEVDELNERIDNIEPGLSDDAKVALLDCFAHVAWVDEHGQDYYDALEQALYENVQYLTVNFTPGDDVFFTDDSLDILKPHLTVTFHDGSESTIIQPSAYSLSGSLTVGQNTITVIYQTHSATFTVSAIANIASTLENFVHPTVAASGTYTMSDGILNVVCASQNAVDNWWTWIADTKGAYWNDVVNKTVYCRVKVKKTGTTDADAFINWYVSMFSSDDVTSMNNNTRRFHVIDNTFTLTTDYVTRTSQVIAIPDNFTVGNVVPDSNTKIGMLFFIRSLDTVNFAEIKMGVA